MNRFAALLYHNLTERPSSAYQADPDALRSQVRWLRGEGFVVEGLGGLARRLSDGDEVPEAYAVLTFDDGHRSNLRAAEIVREEGGQATFFPSVRHCREEPDYLKAPDIAALGELAEVGSHGVTHRWLHRMPVEELRGELQESRNWLADILQRPVDLLSLPGGGGSRTVRREAAAAGYRLIGTSIERWNTRAGAARGTVGRVMVRPDWDEARFQAVARCRPGVVGPRWARSIATDSLRRVLSQGTMIRLSQARRRLRSG